MGMDKMNRVLRVLGPMYFIAKRDGIECICRDINDRFEFEVTGFFGPKAMTVNLWQKRPWRELLAIYSGIATPEELADTLGYLAFRYQNLQEKIRVEREDPARSMPARAETGANGAKGD